MKTIRQLNEGINCDAIFQKEVFGWLSGENNTSKESLIYSHLEDFIMDNKYKPQIVQSLKTLLKCKGRYTRSLQPEAKTKIVYRGIGRYKNAREMMEGVKWDKKTVRMRGIEYMSSEQISYAPHRDVQSFTTDWGTAEDFGHRGLFVQSPVTKDMVFSDAFISWFEKKVGMSMEHEVIRVSNKPLKVKAVIAVSQYEMYWK